MSKLVSWAEKELNMLVKDDEDGMQTAINNDILDIVRTFANQGHSGFSASYSLSIIKKLLNWKPIVPLTGEDDEWNDIGDNKEQNNRYSAVFRKNKDNSTAYNIEGKVFSDNGGETWFTNKDSFVPITFPYAVPEKPEYIILK